MTVPNPHTLEKKESHHQLSQAHIPNFFGVCCKHSSILKSKAAGQVNVSSRARCFPFKGLL